MPKPHNRDTGAVQFGIAALGAIAATLYLVGLDGLASTPGLVILAAVVSTLLALTSLVLHIRPIHVRRTWPSLAGGSGLVRTVQMPGGEVRHIHPRLRLWPFRHGWTVSVRLLPGQTPTQYGKLIEAFTHQWRALDVQMSTPRRGHVRFRVYTRDPLRRVLPALSLPASVDLAALPVGRTQDGATWRLRLLGTHVLIAGETGSGKSSVQWSTIRALLPGVRAGLVKVVALDPKRVELAFGKSLFAAYECDAEPMVKLLEVTALDMAERADRYAGKVRNFTPTVADPFVLVMVDEVAYLTAYQFDRKLRDRALAALATITTQGRAIGFCVMAALQDPRKDVLSIRGLFPTAIALRLAEDTQVEMVLGDGALEAGARAHEIDERLPGVAYVRHEGSGQVTRVRAAYVSDEDIDAMTAAEEPLEDEPAPVVNLFKAERDAS